MNQDAEPAYAGGAIRALHQALRSGHEHPQSLLEQSFAAIERSNSLLHAVAHTQAAAARESAADSAERYRSGRPIGPLDGVPILVKAMIATQGWPMDPVSDVLAGTVSEQDASIVAALRAAGAVLVGATTQDEFALTTLGPARTPYDPGRTAGGSSGGSAAAVSAGMAYGALGTDTGGSIRIPAAFCGVVGLKPTYGLLPTDGIVTLAWSLDHVGPIGRSVDDVRLLLNALLAGREQTDTTPKAATQPRIGVPTSAWLSLLSEPLLAAFDETLEAVHDSGAELVEVDLPDQTEVKQIHWTVLSAELASYHHRVYGTAERRYREPMLEAIAAGSQTLTSSYAAAQRARRGLRSRIDTILDRVDAIALPTVAIEPPPIGDDTVTLAGVEEDATAAMVRLTSLANHTGHPAISVPGVKSRQLPTGIQLIGRTFEENSLLATAEVVERAVG